jgi:glycosyltransferase involved in cell wall biosynthesis
MTYEFVSVIVPAYSQADHIGLVLSNYGEALDKLGRAYEMVVVVNGPEDGTFEACQHAAETSENIRIERSKPGWAMAVQQGIASCKGDLICFTNSARTAPSDLLAILLFALAYPGVVVKANRKTRDSLNRRLGSLLYNLECRALFNLANFDVNGTPKAFPRSFDRLLALQRHDDVIDAEFNAVCLREGYPVLEVPIVSTRRHGGTSTTSLRTAMRLYWGALDLWYREFRPTGK